MTKKGRPEELNRQLQPFHMSQWNPRKENTCHLAVITLLPLPMVNPEETLRIQDYRPPGSCAVLSLVLQSCPTLWPHGLQPARLLCLWNSPVKNTRVGIHSLLQGISQTQGSNPGLLHCRQIPYRLSHQGSPQIAEVHIKEIILMIPDSCIFLYLEKYYIPLIRNAASWIWRSVFLKSTNVK